MPSELAQAGAEKSAAAGSAGFKVPLLGTAGGIVTAAALVAMFGHGPVASGHSKLSMVAQSEIAATAATLAPGSSAQITEEAKICMADVEDATGYA